MEAPEGKVVYMPRTEFLPDEAIPPIKMGDGEAPVAQELKYLGSMLLKQDL